MNLARRILEGIQEVELQVTPEFQKSPGVKLKPEVRKDVLLSSMMTVENDSKAPISSSNAVLIMMDAVSKDLSKDDVENILTNKIPVEWGYLGQHNTFTVWPKPHHNEAQFNAAVRWILEELKGGSTEKEKVPSQKLMDVIGDYVDMEVIAVDDLSKDPHHNNRVWFPGDATKYSIIDSSLFGGVQKRVNESGMHWGWSEPHRSFYLYPTSDMSVSVFWNRVYNLVSWFLDQPGIGTPTPKEEDE